MSLPVVLRPAAQAEFDEAALWYENQRVGLGRAFVTEIQRVLDNIAEKPERYPFAEGEVREAPASRFPYCIYYRIKPTQVVVLAVFHTSRNPAIWRRRASQN